MRIEAMLKPEPDPVKPPVDPSDNPPVTPPTTKVVENLRTVYRQSLFQMKTLHNEEEVDKYLEIAKKQMMQNLNGFDGIKIQ